MRRFLLFIFFLFCFSPLRASAFEIKSDPQYVVMNFSTITDLNWAAPENEWQQKIKPQILSQLHDLQTALPKGTDSRKLAWSTLMEYMNTPLDTPNQNSPYAVKMRRILEITDEQNLPLFIPLNGFQWTDQLPELYNWWDPDGTHTDPKFFARQRNPVDFKQRFIASYNPKNIWNVEWQGWNTPMKLNVRNWGGGGFHLAPPPALTDQHRSLLTYRDVQKGRLRVILEQLVPYLQKWETEGRSELFAGLSIGTEISLNASVTARDEFAPYGYRDVQDVLCNTSEPTCGTVKKFTQTQISTARLQSVDAYLTNLARFIQTFGIPKQRIYTHVWSESLKGDPRYENYAASAFNLYSRGGMSFYGYAHNPLSHPDWKKAVEAHGKQAWGAIEYSAGTSQGAWSIGLKNVFNNPEVDGKIEVTYNWDGHKNTGAIPALKAFLRATPKKELACSVPEIIPVQANGTLNPRELSWNFLSTPSAEPSMTVHFKKGAKTSQDAPNIATQQIPPLANSALVPLLPPGIYSWYTEASGCNGYKQTSEPRTFVVGLSTEKPNEPLWVQLVSSFEQEINSLKLRISNISKFR